MMVHVYRVGESDNEGLHEQSARVTVFNHDHPRYGAASLVIGTLPNLTVIPLSKIRWFWVEEN